VEIHKKIAIPFSCIIFLILGAGVGYTIKRGGMFGILVSIILFSVYYILFLVGEELADRNLLSPFLGMWFPNLIIAIFAFDFFYYAEHEQSFILSRVLKRD
ncbi:MAG: LptF/LptG family permease, partial [candidate division WOR-3 bacterium]